MVSNFPTLIHAAAMSMSGRKSRVSRRGISCTDTSSSSVLCKKDTVYLDSIPIANQGCSSNDELSAKRRMIGSSNIPNRPHGIWPSRPLFCPVSNAHRVFVTNNLIWIRRPCVGHMAAPNEDLVEDRGGGGNKRTMYEIRNVVA